MDQNEIERLKALNEELRFSVESLIEGFEDLAHRIGRARGILKTAGETVSPAVSGAATRTLVDGTTVTASPVRRLVGVDARCPGKWLLVDLETGDIWDTGYRAVGPGGSLFGTLEAVVAKQKGAG